MPSPSVPSRLLLDEAIRMVRIPKTTVQLKSLIQHFRSLTTPGAPSLSTPTISLIPKPTYLRSSRNTGSKSVYGVCRSRHLYRRFLLSFLRAPYAPPVNPYISQLSTVFQEAVKGGYLIKRTDGTPWQ